MNAESRIPVGKSHSGWLVDRLFDLYLTNLFRKEIILCCNIFCSLSHEHILSAKDHCACAVEEEPSWLFYRKRYISTIERDMFRR
jgi:hypothetical protein